MSALKPRGDRMPPLRARRPPMAAPAPVPVAPIFFDREEDRREEYLALSELTAVRKVS